MKILSLVLFLAGACTPFMASPANPLACACCADRGYYSISYRQPDSYLLEEIAKIRFASQANLFMGAGEGNIKGLPGAAETYDFRGEFVSKTLKMTFTDHKKSGILTLPLPAKILAYKVDTRENSDSQGDVTLYKELRFEGTVSGTGIFQTGIAAPTKYFLVLQGRGNVCDSAADYTHWHLEITGKKADYVFYGSLQKQ